MIKSINLKQRNNNYVQIVNKLKLKFKTHFTYVKLISELLEKLQFFDTFKAKFISDASLLI